MSEKKIAASDIQIGDVLPPLQVAITAQKIISAAAATRDWQPIHHDHDIAIKSGLRGIILNAPSQTGLISKYVTDWAGSQAQIKRLSFKMRDSICPGDALTISGEIIGKDAADNGLTRLTAKVTLAVGETIKTIADVRFEL